jgi:membrane protein required for colicin V production
LLFILLGIGAYFGFKKGMIREILSFIALIVAVILGFKLMDKGIELLEPYIGKVYGLIPFIAFLVIVIGVILLVYFIGVITKKILNLSIFGLFDSFLGAVLGVLIWGLCAGIVLWISKKYIPFPLEYTKGAFLYPALVSYAEFVIDKSAYVMPFAKDLTGQIDQYFNK